MAPRNTTTEADGFTDVNATEDESGWTDVETEAQIIFDTIGDTFTGIFEGWSETANNIPQAHFMNDEGKFFTNCGWSLKEQLKNIRKGWTVRMVYTADQPIPDRDTPMKVFKVQYKK